MSKLLRVGTLGSPATFAGEATGRIRQLRPDLDEPIYFSTEAECWSALADGSVDVMVIGVERTGQPHHGQNVLRHNAYVIGRLTQKLGCNLYLKAGASPIEVTTIVGHGSIHQCTAYLKRAFPNAAIRQHHANSVEAAKSVVAGPGDAAVVGSATLPKVVDGLELFATDIDDGSASSWWMITRDRDLDAAPDEVLVSATLGADGLLGQFVQRLAGAGFTLGSVAAFPAARGVLTYDYILMFAGKGRLTDVESVLADFPGARCFGAFKRFSGF